MPIPDHLREQLLSICMTPQNRDMLIEAIESGAGDLTADEIHYNNTVSGLTATDVQEAIDEIVESGASGGITALTGDVTAAGLGTRPATVQFVGGASAAQVAKVLGNANSITGYDNSGELQAIPNFVVDTNSHGMGLFPARETDSSSDYLTIHNSDSQIIPTENSGNAATTLQNLRLQLDPGSTGYDIGTNNRDAATLLNMNITHGGTSDTGRLAYINMNSDIGNGTDPITIDGIAYTYGFGDVKSNVTIDGSIQGYGFQLTVEDGVVGTNNFSGHAFYDFANINATINGYDSAVFNPSIKEIPASYGASGVNVAPHIQTLGGGFNGLGVFPTIDNVTGNATGISVNMDNVTLYAGVKASKVIQDLTYTAFQPGTFGNSITIAYVNDGTAGSETAALVGTALTVHMQSGVSTATQIKTAVEAVPLIGSNLVITISGTGSHAQTAVSATNLTGGVNPGSKKAAEFRGDVDIQGNLSFTGALSLGAINAYAQKTIENGGGNPESVHSIISALTAPANTTTANGDSFGINTASLMSFEANSHTTTSLVGMAALGLPAVVSMASGSTVDLVSGAVFALSLDSSATGGAIDVLKLCRALSIPNGTTTVTRQMGFAMDLPFGDAATTSWGVYITPTIHNYMAGNLMIGGTAGSNDTVTNNSVGLELKSSTKAFLPSRMSLTERNALTPVNGMVIYNTTSDKLQVRAAGAWVDLH